jgi:glycosyltransferase involved in cell wall biosynthesis
MEYPDVSIVIRTLNEEERLSDWLDFFKKNPYPGSLELIVADNESTDGTIQLAKNAGCKIVIIPREKFSYPRQINAGIEKATNELIVVAVAHAYPLRKDWLLKGIRHFSDPEIVGVYAPNFPASNATFSEWIFYGSGFLHEKIFGKRVITKTKMGVFGATGLIIRRSIWSKHHFDEKYGGGGEDTQWAKWAFSQGYKIVTDPDFSVRHSHGLGFAKLKKQYKEWGKWIAPSDFDRERIKYRNHLDFRK